MEPERLQSLKEHIVKFQPHLDKHIGRYVDPAGMRILVVGSGWGTEIYWALTRGAEYVVGLDPAPRPSEPLQSVLNDASPSYASRFRILQATSDTAPLDIGHFDFVISNNTFEHVFDLSKTLSSCRHFMQGRGARIAIFTAPLFQSSHGSHLPIEPWGHLTERQHDIKPKVPAYLWSEYQNGLNGMTLTTLLSAIREAGLILQDIYIVPDRSISQFIEILPQIPPGLKPMDLCLEGVGCLLSFPENL